MLYISLENSAGHNYLYAKHRQWERNIPLICSAKGFPQHAWDINGSHILIMALRACHTAYFNHKRWYSIRLQAVVDGRGLFLNFYPGQSINLHHMSFLWQKKKMFS